MKFKKYILSLLFILIQNNKMSDPFQTFDQNYEQKKSQKPVKQYMESLCKEKCLLKNPIKTLYDFGYNKFYGENYIKEAITFLKKMHNEAKNNIDLLKSCNFSEIECKIKKLFEINNFKERMNLDDFCHEIIDAPLYKKNDRCVTKNNLTMMIVGQIEYEFLIKDVVSTFNREIKENDEYKKVKTLIDPLIVKHMMALLETTANHSIEFFTTSKIETNIKSTLNNIIKEILDFIETEKNKVDVIPLLIESLNIINNSTKKIKKMFIGWNFFMRIGL